MNRRDAIYQLSGSALFLSTFTTVAFAQEPKKKAATKPATQGLPANIEWHNVEEFGLEGREWTDLARLRYYD